LTARSSVASAADVGRCGWLVGVEQRLQEAVLELGVEAGDADALGCA
jgi:hypothetical protein